MSNDIWYPQEDQLLVQQVIDRILHHSKTPTMGAVQIIELVRKTDREKAQAKAHEQKRLGMDLEGEEEYRAAQEAEARAAQEAEAHTNWYTEGMASLEKGER